MTNQKQSSSTSSHICGSLDNLQNALADLKGYLARAKCLKEYDDQVFAHKKEIVQNEIDFLRPNLPHELQNMIKIAKKELDALVSEYENSKKISYCKAQNT